MSQSDIDLFPEIRSYPEIRSSMDGSAFVDPEIRSYTGMDSRLYMAAEEGDVNALNNLIEDKYSIFQAFTGLGNSVLHIAISCGKLRFAERVIREVKKKLEAGREFVRAKNSDGNTALHLAAFHGHHELVEKMVSVMEGDVEGGDDFLRSQNHEGNTALHEAAKGTPLATGLTEEAAKWTLLATAHIEAAADRQYLKVVQVLLENAREQGDLIGLPNNEGETALFLASQNGRTRIVEKLLPAPTPNSNMKRGDGQTPPPTTPNSNMKRGDGQTPLHSAVLNGHTDVVDKLLQRCPELAKETDNCGRTAMHMLAFSGTRISIFFRVLRCGRKTAEIVGQLVAKDNSLCYKQDNNKQTPIHLALELERYDLANILLSCGRDCIEAVDKDGRKPLHLALLNTTRLSKSIFELYKFKEMLLSLISKESVNHPDNTGRTPLDIAVDNSETDPILYECIINLLESHGALRNPIIRRMRQSRPNLWLKAENISINAVLIATVSFAAAFTLPGGLDSEQKAVLLNTFLFKLFVIYDTLSFCASISSAVIIQYGDKRDQQDPSQILWSVRLMWLALVSLLVAFGAAINMVITPSPWLVGTVWTMVYLVPLSIFYCLIFKTRFVFDSIPTIVFAIALPLALPLVLLVGLLYVLLALLLSCGLSYMILSKRRASQTRLLKRYIDHGR